MRNNLVGFSEETLQKYNLIRIQPVWFNEGEEVLPGICIWQTFTSRITKLLSCSHEAGAKTACGIDNFFFFLLQTHILQLFWVVGNYEGVSIMNCFCFWFHWYILPFYFYYVIMCCIPFLSSVVDWRAGKENESFATMRKRMSYLIWRLFRLSAWSGRPWHQYGPPFVYWQLFIMLFICNVTVPTNTLQWTCSNGQWLTQRNSVGSIREDKE